ncbi:MAG: oligosaccharide flippase family protein, partial [Erysipelotrichaceae bacterium]|nr:oligosaccharide flippase family protein [Erysipelotrichaceae bacterium]
MFLNKYRLLLKESPIAKNLFLLISGTVIGQIILFLFTPILTRLYSPHHFGVLSVYMSIVAVLSVAACLRFDMAIPIPEDDKVAINLTALAMLSASVISMLLSIPIYLFPNSVCEMMGNTDMNKHLWVIPIGVWLVAVYSAIQLWSIRKCRFVEVSKTQISRSVGASGIQAALGLYNPLAFGLVFGHMFYGGYGAIGLIMTSIHKDRRIINTITIKSLIENFIKWRRYPIYSTPEAILDTAACYLPVILISSMVSTKEAGYMMLAQRVVSVPIGVFGGGLSRVYLSEAGKKLKDGDLKEFTFKIMSNLLKASIIPFILMAFMSPFISKLIFGTGWSRTGVMIAWAVPSMILQFISSPVSTIFYVARREREALYFKLFGFVLMIGSIFV